MNAPGGRSGGKPSFDRVFRVGIAFLRKALRWMGVEDVDVDDVMQDVLVTAYHALDRYNRPRDDSKPAAQDDDDEGVPPADDDEDAALRRWLFGIARRKASHYRERVRTRREIPSGAGPTWSLEAVDPQATPEQAAAEDELQRRMTDLILKIPASRREVLIMYELLEIPIAEIARELRLNESTTRSRLRIAREDLRAAIEREGWKRKRGNREGASEIPASAIADACIKAARRFPHIPLEGLVTLWQRLLPRIRDASSRAECASAAEPAERARRGGHERASDGDLTETAPQAACWPSTYVAG